MKTKQELLDELRSIEEKEKMDAENSMRQKNYESFLQRQEDWVIGKAHCDIEKYKNDYGWSKNTCSLGSAISIHGNCGTSYNPQAFLTHATYIFFHNIWTDKQRRTFQDTLNKVAVKEVKKIMGSLRNVLETMGLQSTSFLIKELFPKNKAGSIEKEIWDETVKILDSYKDSEFLELYRDVHYADGTMKKELNLSNSTSICNRYLKENRPRLFKKLYS